MIVFKWFYGNNKTFEEFLEVDENEVHIYVISILLVKIHNSVNVIRKYLFHYVKTLTNTKVLPHKYIEQYSMRVCIKSRISDIMMRRIICLLCL